MVAEQKNQFSISLEKFAELHAPQLINMGCPEVLWPKIFKKSLPEINYDAGNDFMLVEEEDGFHGLRAKHDLKKEGNVWVVDHSLTCDGGEETRKQFLENPLFIERFCGLLKIKCPDTIKQPVVEQKEEEEKEAKIDPELVKLVMEQANVDEERAIAALKKENFEIINAVLDCIHGEEADAQLVPGLKKKMEEVHGDVDDDDNEVEETDGKDLFEDDKDGYHLVSGVDKKRAAGCLADFENAMAAEAKELGKEEMTKEQIKNMYEDYRLNSGICNARYYTQTYTWKQIIGEGIVEVVVPIPINNQDEFYDHAKAKNKKPKIISKLTKTHWSLSINGKTIFKNEQLKNKVDLDCSIWSIRKEDSAFVMILEKKDQEEDWNELFLISKENENIQKLKPKHKSDAYRQLKKNYNGIIRAKDIIKTTDAVVQAIKDSNLTYQMQIVSPNGTQSIETACYVMDEVGSGLSLVSEKHNIECHPFVNTINGQKYTIIWPCHEIKEHELCTRLKLPKK